jgi:hypothetical protein
MRGPNCAAQNECWTRFRVKQSPDLIDYEPEIEDPTCGWFLRYTSQDFVSRNVEGGAHAQGAPSVAKLSRCITKRFQPDYRRYLRTVSRCVRLPTHGFPSVLAFGDATILTTGPQGGRGTRQMGERALSQLVRGVGVRVSSGHVWGARSGGFWGICGSAAKTRDATARLSAVSRCRFCCTPMRSLPRRRSSGAA